jgi:hypothetical protein
MRHSALLIAGAVLATPAPAQAAGTRTLDCDRSSIGQFQNVFADARSVVVGPVALAGLRSASTATAEQRKRTGGYIKSALLLEPGRTATVTVDPEARRFARLIYGGGDRLDRPGLPHTVRFTACDRRGSDSRAGSKRVTFWSGGFVVASEAFCLRFTVTVDGVKHRRRLPIDGGAC